MKGLRGMWNDIAELRTFSSYFQWISIGLVFVSGFLQVGKFIVDRREKALSAIEQAEKLNPVSQVIRTATAVVELHEASNELRNNHFMDSGAALGFAQGNVALMVLRSLDSFALQQGNNDVLWRATLNLDFADAAVGKPMRSLKNTDHIELIFGQLKEGATVKSGRITVTINSAVQIQADIPPQTVAPQQLIIIQRLDDIKEALK